MEKAFILGIDTKLLHIPVSKHRIPCLPNFSEIIFLLKLNSALHGMHPLYSLDRPARLHIFVDNELSAPPARPVRCSVCTVRHRGPELQLNMMITLIV